MDDVSDVFLLDINETGHPPLEESLPEEQTSAANDVVLWGLGRRPPRRRRGPPPASCRCHCRCSSTQGTWLQPISGIPGGGRESDKSNDCIGTPDSMSRNGRSGTSMVMSSFVLPHRRCCWAGVNRSRGGGVAKEVQFNLPVWASTNVEAVAHQMLSRREEDGRGPTVVRCGASVGGQKSRKL